MELQLFKVNVVDDNNFYVLAYSWEHALVLVAEMSNVPPDEYRKEDVKEVSSQEAKETPIDYNYLTDKREGETLYQYAKRQFEADPPIYGVITDDFVSYD